MIVTPAATGVANCTLIITILQKKSRLGDYLQPQRRGYKKFDDREIPL